MVKKQLNSEMEKEATRNDIERFQIYGEILDLNGLYNMYDPEKQLPYFDLHKYRMEFRHVFYSKFYLLDQEIAELVKKIDIIALQSSFLDKLHEEDAYELVRTYIRIIEFIEEKLRKHRLSD